MAEDRNEVGNEVKGEKGITNSRSEQPAYKARGLGVAVEALIEFEVLFDLATDLQQGIFQPHDLFSCG